MILCYLGLGSNLRSPKRQLHKAIRSLHKLPRSVIRTQSSIYISAPHGVRAQPSYANMVIKIYTSLSPTTLLRFCQRIENAQQRIRKKRWGARTLDIDLLLYGNRTIKQNNLVIPHPEMLHRDFVMLPLLEIDPDTQLPNGKRIDSYLKIVKNNCINYT